MDHITTARSSCEESWRAPGTILPECLFFLLKLSMQVSPLREKKKQVFLKKNHIVIVKSKSLYAVIIFLSSQQAFKNESNTSCERHFHRNDNNNENEQGIIFGLVTFVVHCN